MRKRNIIGTIVLIFGTLASVFGQNGQYTKNSADQTLRSNGRVNPSSLGMEMDVPLGAYPGRGINLPLGLSYSSKLWRFQQNRTDYLNNGNQNHYVFIRYSEDSASGWSSSLSQAYIEYTGEFYRFDGMGRQLAEVSGPGQSPSGDVYLRRVLAHLPGGGVHELRADDTPIATNPTGTPPPDSAWEGNFYSTDGSGIRYVQQNSSGLYRLYMPDGSYYDFNSTREGKNSVEPYINVRRASRLSDVNGNYVQFNAATSQYPNGSWTDQLGRTFPVIIPRETPSIPENETILEQTFVLPGMTQGYTLRWKKLKGNSANESAFTDFDTQELGQYAAGANYLFTGGQMLDCSLNNLYIESSQASQYFNPVLLTDIVLPNGTSYRFSYNKYGEIEQIHYPTGGREEIAYAQVPSLAELAAPYKKSNRGVVNRKIFESDADATGDTWTYSAESSKSNYRTSVIAPDGTQTDRFMHRGVPPPTCAEQNTQQAAQNYYAPRWGYDNILSGMTYEERSFSSAGQVLQRTLTRWTVTNTGTLMTIYPGRYAQRNARTLSTESIIYDGSAGLSSATVLEYDTDADSPGSPLNVKKTRQYAYKVVSDGSAYTPGMSPPVDTVLFTDPSDSAPLLKSWENIYLQNDPNYSTTKDYYLANNLLKLVTSTKIRNAADYIVAQTEVKYDEPNYGGGGYRGQSTTVRNWLDTNDSWLEIRSKYDTYGNVVEVTDANNKSTITEYDATYHTYPVKVSSPIPDTTGANGSNTALVSRASFDLTTGLPLTSTDSNEQVTQMQYNDALLRPTKVIAPNGQQTITEYGAGTSDSTRFVKVKTQIDETKWKEVYSWYDGLGRTIKTQSVDSNGDVFSVTEYDNMGRVKKVSNPFRNISNPSCTTNLECTVTDYDTAGRMWKVTAPDGAVGETTYTLATAGSQIGTVVTVKDQALRERRSIKDALGQLIRVDEPTDTGGLGSISSPNQPTVYAYDTLSNLKTVTQGSQTRTFVYDSLSRLKQATNPESGTINYGYDLNGNLSSKTDARNITTTYVYDNLSRVKMRSYSDSTPTVNYFYDNLTNARGKLIKVSSDVSTSEYTSFDIMGRITGHKQTTDGTAYTTAYVYNLSGALLEETYPSTRVIKNVVDSDGDLAKVQSKKTANASFRNYAQNFTYSTAGAVSSIQLGNTRWESTQFNNRLQPTQIALGTSQNATDLLKLNYEYGALNLGTGQVTAGTNNGNIGKQTITVPTAGSNGFTATQYYAFDSLNRIKIASENVTPNGGTAAQSWQQTFTYDRYGNRNFDEANTTTLPKNCGTSPNFTVCSADVPIVNPSVNTTTNKNQLNGYTYDVAGNTTRDAQNRKFIYDAENKQTKVENVDAGGNPISTAGQYFYDGDGKRVKKIAGNEVTIFVYDVNRKIVAEYSNQISQTPQVSYLTEDHLGSPRINTDKNGNVISRHDYHPFGEEIARATYGADDVRKKFTGYERDFESSLDFGQARYYSSRHGRFYSVDPENYGAYEDDPQTWNAYMYSRNNPILYTDPEGLDYKLCNNEGKCWTHSDDEVAKSKDSGEFIWEGSRNQKTGFDSGILYDSEGNQIGTYQQTSHDSPIMQMLWGASDKLNTWQPIIEELGQLELGLFALPPGAGKATDYLAGTIIKRLTVHSMKGLAKSAAMKAVEALPVSEAAKQAAKRAVQRASGSNATIDIITTEAGDVIVKVTRPGFDGYQVMENYIKADGTKSVFKRAVDSTGKVVKEEWKKN